MKSQTTCPSTRKQLYIFNNFLTTETNFPRRRGGDDILTEVLGTDASEAFHEVGHSAEAIEQLKPLLRGILDLTSSVSAHFQWN